ncbi:hypothetical protein LQF61_04375 [Tetragenococcus koreensis]|uniref:Uncharacterized protein n=1 Tax=Tetragenococcus koreensis TaxID=290335 RepID=A0AAN4ZS08_9ENTE|nr:hypothetical protein [Tetragenococcus koreensis]AYW44559.1 hypothetical protein C7K43_00595 [Tetragenococcus koreensis]MCF1584526.1 hypothetical protein [Tetragenococcus koreensis]MCF1614075.1 hypothetical protein [Tetragenococcus koreensis]MCF1617719.1 hypothetical protein [Tetragenococcus koreensis]MCF1619316.1 hypothetical protein [Tetragenococcus koreensis]
METFIALAIGLLLFIWIIRARTCLSRLIAIVLFIFLLWLYRIEVASVADRIGQTFNVDDVSGRFYSLLTNSWQRLTQWFGQLIR